MLRYALPTGMDRPLFWVIYLAGFALTWFIVAKAGRMAARRTRQPVYASVGTFMGPFAGLVWPATWILAPFVLGGLAFLRWLLRRSEQAEAAERDRLNG